MSEIKSKEIRSTLTNDGNIEISIIKVEKPIPLEDEVLIKVEAAPINPSDLGLLISFAADLQSLEVSGSGDETIAKIKINRALIASMKQRLGLSMQVGNEGSGKVIDAGIKAKNLIGKTVSVAVGGMYSQYRCAPVNTCLVMDDSITFKEAASSFVNPLTALAFIETMKMENHSAIVNTAAASNLGQMLIKICNNDSIPLVNIVRKSEHVEFLKKLGAKYVCNTSEPDFMDNLVEALLETGATLGFDATGGGNEGKLPGQILSAMEIVANKISKKYSRYGSSTHKQVYIYGALDHSPTILKRSYGLQWGLSGWLLMPMIQKIGKKRFQEMKDRVVKEIKTTFASKYISEISFEEMLNSDVLKSYAKQVTGEKYLVRPHK